MADFVKDAWFFIFVRVVKSVDVYRQMSRLLWTLVDVAEVDWDEVDIGKNKAIQIRVEF